MNTNKQHPIRSSKVGQRGASAIEFVFVFPLLFLLVYGVIVYSYVYVIQQSITYGAQQSAEAAVAVNPIPESTLDARIQTQVRAVAVQSLNWLPPGQLARVTGADGTKVKVDTAVVLGANQVGVKVTLEFDLKSDAFSPLFPTLTLPFVGDIPPLPDQLRAQAIARI